MRELLRRHRVFFLVFAAAAIALRVFFFLKFRFVEGDSFFYGEIAKNWLQGHGYSRNGDSGPVPTMIRLPGYPGFLALIWMFTGVEHYNAVMIAQVVVDVLTCFLVAALALELVGDRAARWAFALTALCPFLPNFAATPLTETLCIFFVALTFYCAARACRAGDSLGWWAGCGAAIGASILLRPDGGLLLPAFGVYFALRLLRSTNKQRVFVAGVLVAAVAFAPLVPWTIRNWRVFHRFQPLAPRYATDPDEFVVNGYIQWTETWLVEYAQVEDFYWPIPGEEVDTDKIPPQACDTPAQCDRTRDLFTQYNETKDMTPDLDAKFGELGRERKHADPFRYYVKVPLLRLADMWLRPRTEMLPLESHWWDTQEDARDAHISWALGALNLFYIFAFLLGAATRRVKMAGVLLLFVLFRTMLLATVENPESRYTLECFPVLFVFAAAWLARAPRRGGLTPSA